MKTRYPFEETPRRSPGLPAVRALLALAVAVPMGCGPSGGGSDDAAWDISPDTVMDTSADLPDGSGDPTDAADDGDQAGCVDDAGCDDSDPCTVDTCDTDFGSCEHSPTDADGDGYPAIEVSGAACGGSDCDDADGAVHPDAAPDCAGSDMDCDGLADRDEDADGYMTQGCPAGDDCDDADATVFPGSPSTDCSLVDHDCNGHADVDNDDDGYDREGCPSGDDCDDEDPIVHPGASEVICDGKDTDCNGHMHENEDGDDDGWAHSACVAGGMEPDCDDADASTHPGATEICDAADQDCDGEILDAAGADDDSDTVLDAGCGGLDCDDTRGDVFAGAAEHCEDGVDQDCDGVVDGPGFDGTGAQICDVGRQAFSPVAAWNGSEYGVVFVTFTDYGDQDLHFARMSASGAGIGTDVLVVDNAGYVQGPDLAWTGSAYALAWADDRPGHNEVFVKLLSPGGAALTSDTQVSSSGDTAWFASLVWAASELGVAWEDYRTADSNIFFARVGTDGARIGTEVQVTTQTSAQVQPSLVWTGTRYGLVWSDSRDGNREIYFTGLHAAGALATTERRLTDSTGVSSSPDLAWTGSEFAVAWSDNRTGSYDILFARMDASGFKLGLDVPVRVSSGTAEDPSISWMTSQYALAFVDDDPTPETVYLVTLSASGMRTSSDITVPAGGARTSDPFAIWNASTLGVAWQDYRTSPVSVWFSLVSFCD